MAVTLRAVCEGADYYERSPAATKAKVGADERGLTSLLEIRSRR